MHHTYIHIYTPHNTTHTSYTIYTTYTTNRCTHTYTTIHISHTDTDTHTTDPIKIWAGKMAQRLKVFTAKLDNLSWILGMQTVEWENQLLQVILWPPNIYCDMYMLPPKKWMCFKKNLRKERNRYAMKNSINLVKSWSSGIIWRAWVLILGIKECLIHVRL